MDIISIATLSMFGSAAVGGLVGFVVGRFSRFEIGLSVGLAIFGTVTLGFAALCFAEYRTFATAGSRVVWGEVVAIVDKPSNESGSITSPAPIVRFTAPDGHVRTIEGPTASGAKPGEHVTVLLDADAPQGARIGRIEELRGGAIAFLLFGTFPLSFVAILVAGIIEDRRTRVVPIKASRRGKYSRTAAIPRNGHASTAPSTREGSRFFPDSAGAKAMFVALAASIAWIAVPGEDLIRRFAEGFGGVAASLLGYVPFASRLGLMGTVVVLMLALNFGVWSFALFLLG